MNYPYNKAEDIIIIITEDYTGRKIDKKKANIQDEDEIMRMINSLIEKYKLNFEIIKKDKSLSWVKADEEFKW